MIVAQSPQLLGIGVDEDTAAVVEDVDGHEILQVVGRGAVTIFDPARIVTNAYEAKRSAPLLASGVVLHVLPARRALRPDHPHAGPRRRRGRRPGRGRRDRRGRPGPAPAGPRHRRRRRLAQRAAPPAGPHAARRPPHDPPARHPHPDQDGASS